MKYERKLSHCIYDNKQHFCWTTKYRYKMLKRGIGERLRELIRQVCKEYDVEILEGHVRPEHVHIVVSRPPNISESKLMQYIKGKTGRELLREFQELRKKYYGGHLWARGYYVATVGNITDEMIIEYVKNQDIEKGEEDNFEVTG